MDVPLTSGRKNKMKRVIPLLLLGWAAVAAPQEGDFRFRGKGVALESAENKGLSRSDVEPATPLVFPRPRPLPEFTQTARKEEEGSIARKKVEIRLAGDRGGDVETGFPFPRGGLFDPRRIRLLDAEGREIPAQVEATAFWPDGSIKWAFLQFAASGPVFVEFGNEVRRQEVVSPLRLSREGDIVTIHTGALEAKINAAKFNVIQELSRMDGAGRPADRIGGFSPEGIQLTAEDGTVYSSAATPPTAFAIEQEGPKKIVVRVEGAYANGEGRTLMRYVTRLVFRAHSTRVEIIHRHINDALEREFTDFRSLEMPFHLAPSVEGGQLLLPGGKETPSAKALRVFQEDENRSLLTEDGQTKPSGRSPGALTARANHGHIGVVIRDFWQRWPKALGLDQGRIAIDLLPRLPDATFGTKLPPHLMYPFVNGNYRMKWGMAFTERVTLDGGDSANLAALAASVNEPPLAIIPSAWYEETGALGLLAAKDGKEFEEWDEFFDHGYQAHMRRRKKNREYGFLNFGDWFGERGRNWGNNEYDIAHAFFMQFARTGKPEYHRLALEAARHQSDSDIVHAYPDPAYVGANPEHAIGHTGTWTQNTKYAAWSHKYDTSTDGRNGHTWAEGMTEAWFLTGDPTVMESTLLLGEHITWAVAPTFEIFPAYPRSAGWMLRAILAIYRATGDPEYLKAADAVARSAMEKQDPSGIWVRKYRTAGTGGQITEEIGQSNFQMGLTLAALAQYYDVTGNPAAREAVLRGVGVLAKAWPGSGGWPYDIRADGTPSSGRLRQALTPNVLNVESLAYMGLREDNPELLRLAETVLLNTLFYQEPVATGQTIGLTLRSGQATLGALRAAYKKHGTQWPGLATTGREETFFKGILEARKFELRGPGRLTFLLKTDGQPTTIRLFRSYRDAFSSAEYKGKIRLSQQDGAPIHEQETLLAGARQDFEIALPEQPNGIFLLEIEEPDRGIWDMDATPLKGALMKATPHLLLAAVTISKYLLAIPQGTESLTLSLKGTHEGAFGAALLDENGRALGIQRGVTKEDHTPIEELTVKLQPGQTGASLPLILWAGGDLQIAAEGMPLWLARNAEEFFQPEKQSP